MNRAQERNRRLAIALVAGAGAAIVWYVFHGVYDNLSASEKAVGYVDGMTQAGIDLGYAVMIGGTLILALIGLWSAFQYLRLLIGRDR
jgi:ABC-type Fe3+-siderophore transport system permease subunit